MELIALTCLMLLLAVSLGFATTTAVTGVVGEPQTTFLTRVAMPLETGNTLNHFIIDKLNLRKHLNLLALLVLLTPIILLSSQIER